MKQLILITFLFSGILCFAQESKFSYQFHSDEIKGGTFTFMDPSDSLSFKTPASAGYLVASNNPYFQSTRSVGPIPNGTWEIYSIKNEQKSILRLRPTQDVVINNRDGFLIHGVGADSSPEQSSLGCIIISDRDARKKLAKAFQKYGVIKINVTNIVTASGVRS